MEGIEEDDFQERPAAMMYSPDQLADLRCRAIRAMKLLKEENATLPSPNLELFVDERGIDMRRKTAKVWQGFPYACEVTLRRSCSNALGLVAARPTECERHLPNINALLGIKRT